MHKDKTKKVARLQLFGHAATATVAVTLAATAAARHPLTHPRFACVSMRSVEPQPNEAPQVMSSLHTEGVAQLGPKSASLCASQI